MRTSDAGVHLIKSFESCKLQAYKCPAGVWTIGWGHTGPIAAPGSKITQDVADSLLAFDLEFFERGVLSMVKVSITQGQFDALVSFAFNCGLSSLRGSTLLRMLNSGDINGAADQFGRWTKSKGVPLAGLVRRRAAERALFVRGKA